MTERFIVQNISCKIHILYKQLIVLPLTRNKLYLIAETMKKNVEDMVLITKAVVHSKIRNIVNYKA